MLIPGLRGFLIILVVKNFVFVLGWSLRVWSPGSFEPLVLTVIAVTVLVVLMIVMNFQSKKCGGSQPLSISNCVY